MTDLNKNISLFNEDYTRDIKSDYEMFRYLKQFIVLTETDETPYKHKAAYYDKKAHYINDVKVNRYIYYKVKR